MTLLSEAYSELTQTSKMELFGKIVVLNVGCSYLLISSRISGFKVALAVI